MPLVSRDRRAPEWAMAAFKLLGLRTTQSCPLPDGGTGFVYYPCQIMTQSLRLGKALKNEDIRHTNKLIHHPQISLISVLFHRIATTHIHSNYDVDQINRFDFMGLNPTGCQIAILLA